MKNVKKVFIAGMATVLATAFFAPMVINTVETSALAQDEEFLYKENFSPIQNEKWLNDEFISYYAVGDGFPYAVATMEAWIKLDEEIGENEDYGVILGGSSNFGLSANMGYDFRITADRYFQFESMPDSYTKKFSDSSAQIPVGEWTHVAFSYDGTKLELYVNGVLKQTVEGITLLGDSSLFKYRIGNNDKGIHNNNYFKGEIKQVTVYGSAIDGETVVSDMQTEQISSVNRSGLDLMGNWVIPDDKAWTVADTSGNGNDLIFSTQGAQIDATFSDKIDYSFVMIPDTQGLVVWQQERFFHTVDWIRKNKDNLNISYVMHMGDIIDNAKSDEGQASQWSTASAYMSMLDGVTPYSFVLGNHDYDDHYSWIDDRGTTDFNNAFPYSKYSQREDFGGAMVEGQMDNVYYTFTVQNVPYLILALEYAPRQETLNWANDVIEAHPNHRVIVNTHSYLTTGGYYDISSASAMHGLEANYGVDVWEQVVSKHSNVMAAFGGHSGQHDLTIRLDEGSHRNKVFSMMIDFQSFYEGSYDQAYKYDEAFVAVMGIDEDEKKAYVYLVMPEYNTIYNAQNCIVYDFSDPYNTALDYRVNNGKNGFLSGCFSSITLNFSGIATLVALGSAVIAKKRK